MTMPIEKKQAVINTREGFIMTLKEKDDSYKEDCAYEIAEARENYLKIIEEAKEEYQEAMREARDKRDEGIAHLRLYPLVK